MRARQLLQELTNALRTVSERWLIVGICAAVGLGIGAGAVLLATPMYEGTSTVTVSFRDIDADNQTDRELLLSQQQLRAFAALTGRPQVTEAVLELVPNADADTPDELASRVDARTVPNSHLLELTAQDPDPETAGKLAGASGTALAEEIAALDNPQISAAGADVAEVDGPVVPPILPWLGLGLVFGAVAGAVGLLVADRLHPSIRSTAALSAATELPNLAVISADSSADLEPTILRLRPSVPRCEEFRQLRSSLQFVDRGRPHRRLLVTSADPEEGRTTTACNLALTMARAGQRVVLLEGDMTNPRLAAYLGLDGERGLTGVLIGRDEPETVLQPVGDVGPGRLEVMVAGALPSDPASTSNLVASRAMKFVFQALNRRADVIIVDAPALSLGPDAGALATRCDATMLVVRHGHTTKRALQQAMETVDPGVRLLGTVLVMAPAPSSGVSGTGETSTEHPTVTPERAARVRAVGESGNAPGEPAGPDPAGRAAGGQAAGGPAAGLTAFAGRSEPPPAGPAASGRAGLEVVAENRGAETGGTEVGMARDVQQRGDAPELDVSSQSGRRRREPSPAAEPRPTGERWPAPEPRPTHARGHAADSGRAPMPQPDRDLGTNPRRPEVPDPAATSVYGPVDPPDMGEQQPVPPRHSSPRHQPDPDPTPIGPPTGFEQPAPPQYQQPRPDRAAYGQGPAYGQEPAYGEGVAPPGSYPPAQSRPDPYAPAAAYPTPRSGDRTGGPDPWGGDQRGWGYAGPADRGPAGEQLPPAPEPRGRRARSVDPDSAPDMGPDPSADWERDPARDPERTGSQQPGSRPHRGRPAGRRRKR